MTFGILRDFPPWQQDFDGRFFFSKFGLGFCAFRFLRHFNISVLVLITFNDFLKFHRNSEIQDGRSKIVAQQKQ